MPFLLPNQQRQSTEGKYIVCDSAKFSSHAFGLLCYCPFWLWFTFIYKVTLFHVSKSISVTGVELNTLWTGICWSIKDSLMTVVVFPNLTTTSLSSRQYQICDVCLEVESEDYQNCFVLRCVQQLCAVIHTHEQLLHLTVGLGLFSFSSFVSIYLFNWAIFLSFAFLAALYLVSSVSAWEDCLGECGVCYLN